MPTGGVAREEGVLKLVHPGRYVETHRSPVVTSEVMARNPRHVVSRPDVFKFPWIVVRPESILKPGCVFYVVPYQTLYRLLRTFKRPPGQITLPPARHQESFFNPCTVETRVVDATALQELGGRRNTQMAVSFGGVANTVPRKSCLKKQGRENARSQGRRVAFDLPVNHDNHPRDRLLLSAGGH